MTDRLTLVRHAMPTVDMTVGAPQEWQLSAAGRRAARALDLPSQRYLVASEEPKAIQTLEWAGKIVSDARFNEVARSTDEAAIDWREMRRRYVAGEEFPDWEQHADVAGRFDAAVLSHLAVAASVGRHLVVATHGMALTTWLVSRRLIADPVRFWDGIRLPEPFTIDLANGDVRRGPALAGRIARR